MQAGWEGEGMPSPFPMRISIVIQLNHLDRRASDTAAAAVGEVGPHARRHRHRSRSLEQRRMIGRTDCFTMLLFVKILS